MYSNQRDEVSKPVFEIHEYEINRDMAHPDHHSPHDLHCFK